MNRIGKIALSTLMLTGAAAFFAAPASAQDDLGFSFGIGPGFVPYSDPCDYYDYYDEPPPWGLPPDYCDYPVYFEPVYYDGYWYRGPIYSRWYGGERLFWLNGGWRHDGWRGARPDIRWQDRGGWGRGNGAYRGGYDRNRSYDNGGGHNNFYSGGSHNNWSGNSGGHSWSGGNGGSNNVYSGSGHSNWSGNHNWSGGSSSGHSWSGGNSGGHSWSGGGSGGHNWSGGGGHHH